MRTRKERMGEILGNVCWFRSIVNSVNSWSGVTLVLAATLYSVMESQLQPTGFHKKIEHLLDKDYFMFWQHLGQFCPPSARKHLYIYMEEHVFQLVFLIFAIRELVRFPDPLSDGSGSGGAPDFFKTRRGPCLQGNRQGLYKTSQELRMLSRSQLFIRRAIRIGFFIRNGFG